MSSVLANYTLPAILNTLSPAASISSAKPATAKANAAGTTSASSSDSGNNSASGLGSTFLSLLAQELQNQDPTAPVDPTAMVGQMISLNSLQQLIGINQTLSQDSSATPNSAAGVQPATTAASSAALLAANSGIASMLSPSAAAAATTQLPFDPNTMMPTSATNASALAATINSSINAGNIGFSGTNNNMSGGK